MEISEPEKQRLIADLALDLEQNFNLQTKRWFENYLKGAIAYRIENASSSSLLNNGMFAMS